MSNTEFSKALKIGSVAVFSYLACYYMRHLLGVATPLMIATGEYAKEFLGTLSSFYMIAYAVGQLINGTIGDRINPKYMVSIGLFVSGIASIFFTIVESPLFQLFCFIVLGFSLSMLRGPLVKIISENTTEKHAQTCCVFFNFSSFVGPLIASALAIIFEWKNIFVVAGLSVLFVSVAAFLVLTYLEKKNIISSTRQNNDGKSSAFKNLVKVFSLENIGFYMFISGLVEIVAIAVNFWIPTYMNEYLHFSADMSSVLFSVVSTIVSFTPFIGLFVFRLFKNDEFKMIKCAFFVSFVLFVSLIFITNRYLNIIVFLLARIAVGCPSMVLWTIYIPSQAKTGLVSSVNGFLDFFGYAMTFVANLMFTYSMKYINWTGIILLWGTLMFVGFLGTLFKRKEA